MTHSLLVGLFLVTAACGGSVQVIERTPGTGTISVAGNDEAVRSRADEFMRAHCNGRYTLVDERPSGSGWQMAYRCEPGEGTTATLSPEARLDSAPLSGTGAWSGSD